MADVFLSYASADGDQAKEVASLLEEHGHSVWWDRHLRSGERFQQSIQQQLASARAVVVLWTKASVESEWVYSEARRGNQRKALVQLRAREIDIDDLPAPFDSLHCPFVDDTEALLRSVHGLVTSSTPSPPAPAVGTQGRERKLVTVLVTNFQSAASIDPEDLEVRLAPYHEVCRRVIERFGGSLERLAGDALMAAFGTPRAHEDDPERAVRAALEMRDEVERIDSETEPGLVMRIGVATGEAVVSRSQGTGLSQPTVTGQVVNRALQLQTAASIGSVHVDQETYLSSRSSIEFEQHGGIREENPAVGLPTWLALAGRGSAGEDLADSSGPMVGREDELAQLQRSFSRAIRESSVQLVTVVGEPGLGKSRLVQGLRDWLDAQEILITWRQGRCPPYGDKFAYAALAEVVKGEAGILDSDPADLVESKLIGTITNLVEGTELDDQQSWLVARLATLVGLPATEAPREELFTAWRRFLEALAAIGPLVLVVEDLHWADPSLLDFIDHVLEWTVGVPMVIVVTARPEFYDEAPAWAAGHRNVTTLSLVPLDEAESTQLVASLLGTHVIPAGLHTALLARAAGNPLYAREFITILTDETDSGDLDETRVNYLAETLPGSVQAVIAARLDTLPPDSKHLLQAAAVIGHTFWSGAVSALTGIDEATVRTRLHDLTRRDFLRPSRGSRIVGQVECTFGHALIADVAYGQLPRDERANYHQSLASWHANRIADPDVSTDSAVAAYHYLQAYELSGSTGADGPTRDALAASTALWHCHAAENLRASDTPAALKLARIAVDLTPQDDPLRPNRLILVGRLEFTSGHHAQAVTTLDEARKCAERCGDQVVAAHAQVYCSVSTRELGRPREADLLLAQAVAVLEQQPPGLELVAAYLSRSVAEQRAGRSREGRESVDQAMELIRQLEVPPWVLVDALARRGECRIWSGDAEGVQELTRALELAERHHLTGLVGDLHGELATWTFLTRTASESLAHDQAAARVSVMTGQNTQRVRVSMNMAETLVVLGRLDEAEAIYEAAVTNEVVDSPTYAARVWTEWAFVHLVRGDLAAARSLIAKAWPICRDNSLDVLAPCLLTALELQHSSKPPPEHDLYGEQLTRLLEDPDTDEWFAQVLARLARVLVTLGRVDLLEQVLEDSPSGLVFYDNQQLSARAVLAEARHEYAESLSLHERAAAAWAAFGFPLEQAHSLVGAARCSAALGRPARHHLEQTLATLTEIGAEALLAQTIRHLEDAVD